MYAAHSGSFFGTDGLHKITFYLLAYFMGLLLQILSNFQSPLTFSFSEKCSRQLRQLNSMIKYAR